MNFESIIKEFIQVQEKYCGLELRKGEKSLEVVGILAFSAFFEQHKEINDVYEIVITIPEDYPHEAPVTKEISGKIPRRFHTNPDGTLCLASPLGIQITRSKNNTLLGYIENLVIPFLYSYSYKEQEGELPFGELPHGNLGIMTYYKDLFQVSDNEKVLKLLKILSFERYRGHWICPCGFGKKLRHCHGAQLRYLWELQAKKIYKNDYEVLSKSNFD